MSVLVGELVQGVVIVPSIKWYWAVSRQDFLHGEGDSGIIS